MRKIVKMFEDGNVLVFGLRGRGKDMLMANVVCRRKKPYVSNVDYGGQWFPLDLDKLDPKNTYDNFLRGDVNYYEFPYPDGTDVYISDAGVYFPSQYQGQLCAKYPTYPVAYALSRHTGKYNYHTNSQAIGRIWDKIREQADQWILCNRCYVLGRLVIQSVTIYDKYESACAKVPPFPLSRPLFDPNRIQLWEIQKANYLIAHGDVKRRWLIYWNRSNYDTRRFKEMLKNGKKSD